MCNRPGKKQAQFNRAQLKEDYRIPTMSSPRTSRTDDYRIPTMSSLRTSRSNDYKTPTMSSLRTSRSNDLIQNMDQLQKDLQEEQHDNKNNDDVNELRAQRPIIGAALVALFGLCMYINK